MHMLFQVTLLVKDYDEAKQFFVEKLGFVVVEDKQITESKRWIVVAPSSQSPMGLLLAKARNDELVGNQADGKVFLFMHTDDAVRQCSEYRERGVRIVEDVTDTPHGKVFVFEIYVGTNGMLSKLRDRRVINFTIPISMIAFLPPPLRLLVVRRERERPFVSKLFQRGSER